MRDQQQYPLQVKWAAYAGLLFFSFLVQWQLDNRSLVFETQDETFVRWYIKLGKWVLVFSFIIALLRWIQSRFGIPFLSWWIWSFLGMLLWVVLVGMVMISQWKSFVVLAQDIKKEERSQILSLFLPGISTKKRFDALSSGKVNWWVKEAELWWFILMVVGVLDPVGYLWRWGVFLLLFRCGMLFWGRDILPQAWKVGLNMWMFRWGEEIFLFLPALWSWWKDEGSLYLKYQEQQRSFTQKGKMPLWVWFFFVFIAVLFLIWGVLWRVLWKLSVVVYWLMRGMILMTKEQL